MRRKAIVTGIDGRTAREQGVRFCVAAIVAQDWINQAVDTVQYNIILILIEPADLNTLP